MPSIPAGVQRRLAFAGVLIALAAIPACSGPTGPSTPPPPPPPPGGGTPFVFVGAGDIAACGEVGHIATATLLDRFSGSTTFIFTAGDNAYPSGRAADFRDCYDPYWGRHKGLTRPTPGNHDYESPNAIPYYNYFGENAGPSGRGYYAYDVGAWRVIALNSEIDVSGGSPQVQWLRTELSTNTAACTAAIWHRPLFSSGPHAGHLQMRDIWRVLYDANVDVVINGHNHLYERFAPQDPEGTRNEARGIRQFTVGTGGVPLHEPGAPQTNSQTVIKTWGVLKFELIQGEYRWEFVPFQGTGVLDPGSGKCH